MGPWVRRLGVASVDSKFNELEQRERAFSNEGRGLTNGVLALALLRQVRAEGCARIFSLSLSLSLSLFLSLSLSLLVSNLARSHCHPLYLSYHGIAASPRVLRASHPHNTTPWCCIDPSRCRLRAHPPFPPRSAGDFGAVRRDAMRRVAGLLEQRKRDAVKEPLPRFFVSAMFAMTPCLFLSSDTRCCCGRKPWHDFRC